MMGLECCGETVAFQPLEEVVLPQRAVSVERDSMLERYGFEQLANSRRGRQGTSPDVVVGIPAFVRPLQARRRDQGTLRVFAEDVLDVGHREQVLIQLREVIGRRAIWRLEELKGNDVRRTARGFSVQEHRVVE